MAHLTEAQVAQFKEEGYLVVEDVLDPEQDLDPVIEEYAGVLDQLAQELYDKGEISSTYDDLPFGDRLTKIYAESGRVHAQYFDFSLPQQNVQPDTPMWVGPKVFHLLRNEKLLDAIESLIGPEIYSNPVQHVRLKPPEHLCPVNEDTGRPQIGATPWHQDNGVVTEEADETDMLTVWFGLWEATVENGCLEVIPKSHREGLLQHCITRHRPVKGIWSSHSGANCCASQIAYRSRSSAEVSYFSTVSTAIARCQITAIISVGALICATTQRVSQPDAVRFPGFVARSRSNPESELHDAEEWADMWYETRSRLSGSDDNPTFHRWKTDDPRCGLNIGI